ncbi:MAG: ATP-binding protein [Nitrospirae bacterium]|nr:ATP-binding protein [Nitrospirota bacterium]
MSKCTIFSTSEEIERFMGDVCPVIMDFTYGDEIEIRNIETALLELLENALEHGNKREAHRKITIEWEINRESLTFSIEDEGSSTQPKIQAECPPLSSARGRGLWSIVDMGFALSFSEQVNKVTMVIKSKNSKDIHSDIDDHKGKTNSISMCKHWRR